MSFARALQCVSLAAHKRIHCYQPQPGYCSCVLLPEDVKVESEEETS